MIDIYKRRLNPQRATLLMKQVAGKDQDSDDGPELFMA